jgi:hypothetical protein
MPQGTRMLDRRTYPEFMVLRFAHGSITMNMETGVAVMVDPAGTATSKVKSSK